METDCKYVVFACKICDKVMQITVHDGIIDRKTLDDDCWPASYMTKAEQQEITCPMCGHTVEFDAAPEE